MSWAEEWIRTGVPWVDDDRPVELYARTLNGVIKRAIRETIEKCARTADILQGTSSPSMLSASAAIRKLADE